MASLIQYRRQEEHDIESRPLDATLIRRLFSYTRPYARQRNWLIALVLLRSVQIPALTWILAAAIRGPIAHGDARGLFWATAAFVGMTAFAQICMHFRQRLALELGESVVHDLRGELFAKLQTMPLAYFQTTKLGRIISRMTSDVEYVRMGVQEVLFVSLVQVGQMVVAAGFMLAYDWVLFLLVAVLVPVLWQLNRHFHRLLGKAHREVQESFSRVTATLAESVGGIRVTQSFVRQDVNADLFADLVENHSTFNMALSRSQAMFQRLLDLNNQAFLAVLLVVGGWQVLTPERALDVGSLVGFFFMADFFFGPIASLGVQYNHALTAMAGAERVFKLLDAEPSMQDSANAEELPSIAGRIELRHVTFGYAADRPVLHDVNLLAQPGQTIALVGATGSGKTSIMNLIAKFFVPQQGTVAIDDYDLAGRTTQSLRRQMGIVSQQNFLFSGTVLENIRLGKIDATDDEAIEATRRLDCHDLLSALPDGFQTQVGERGGSLSLGQRQLVCFARAMLANPAILFLDEATSSVDMLTEARIAAALARLLAGRTSFVVAHRLSTIRHADQVLVLEHGRIVERGTHRSLVAQGGLYAKLYRRFLQTA